MEKNKGNVFLNVFFSCFLEWNFSIRVFSTQNPPDPVVQEIICQPETAKIVKVVTMVCPPEMIKTFEGQRIICQPETRENFEASKFNFTRKGLTLGDIADLVYGVYDDHEIIETSILQQKINNKEKAKDKFLGKSELSYTNLDKSETEDQISKPFKSN